MSRLWLALLAGGALLAMALGGDGQTTGVRPTAVAADGSFEISNSRQGSPIFTTSNLGPGDSTAGTVTIANVGSRAGFVRLSQTDLGGLPGDLGGSLPDRLRLDVREVSDPAAPAPVYSGGFADMGKQPLGYMAPGARRKYRFTATFPEGGSDDNLYAGSSASVAYLWTGTEGPPPAGAPTSAAGQARDRVPVRLRLRFPPVQRVLTTRRLRLRARCSERCLVDLRAELRTGSKRFPISAIRNRRLPANRSTWLSLRVPRRAMRRLRRALVRHRRPRVRIFVAARDDAGNPAFAARSVRLRARRPDRAR